MLLRVTPFVGIAILCGSLLVVQSGINANLANFAGSGIRSAFISFLTGTALLVPTSLKGHKSWKNGLISTFEMIRDDKKDILMFCGGPLGAFFVASGVLLSPLIGFALFFVAVVTGQLLMSVAYDFTGFYYTERQTVSIIQLTGVVLSVGGAITFQGDALANGDESGVLALIGVAAGAVIIIQSSFNKRLSGALGSPWKGALISFIIGTIALFVAVLVETVITNLSTEDILVGSRWWHYLGGPIGAFVIGAGFILVPTYIGFVLTFASVVLGELIGGLILDEIDAFGLGRRPATGLRGAGLAMVLVGVGLVTYSSVTRNPKTDTQGIDLEMKPQPENAQTKPKQGDTREISGGGASKGGVDNSKVRGERASGDGDHREENKHIDTNT